MQNARPNNAEELKATIRATWALITPEQCQKLIDSMPRRINAVIEAKGAPTNATPSPPCRVVSWPEEAKLLCETKASIKQYEKYLITLSKKSKGEPYSVHEAEHFQRFPHQHSHWRQRCRSRASQQPTASQQPQQSQEPKKKRKQ
ncbi:hypothetical protein J4Q44_G00091570 [Coregonus suidteri]|uniref:Uncharacterized protein n=1 Tax=Coregonus suidteri TaxID=861788 RepID=A0AAN8M931_9TELE